MIYIVTRFKAFVEVIEFSSSRLFECVLCATIKQMPSSQILAKT